MSKSKLRVKAHEYGEQQIEALGFPSRMEFELKDGSVVELIHPWLWDDNVEAASTAVETAADLDRDEDGELKRPLSIGGQPAPPYNVRLAKAVLGAKEHARFVKGGGKSGQIALAIEMMKRRATEDEDADPKDLSSNPS